MNNPVSRSNQEQVAALTELGRRLKHLREGQDLSLEQLAVRTLVSKRMLTAIEQATVEHLPEPVYIQGFIRRYADALGLDGAEFASEFPAAVPLMSARRAVTPRFSIQTQLRPLHLYLLYMMLVGAAVSGLSYVLSRSATPIVIASPAATIAPPASSASDPNLPSQTNASSSQPVAPNQPNALVTPNAAIAAKKSVQIMVKLTDQSWIRVMTDGKTDFEGVLPQGTQRQWMADQQIVVRAGNAGGVIVSLNNGEAKPLGLPGSVEETTFGNKTQATGIPPKSAQTMANSRMPSSF